MAKISIITPLHQPGNEYIMETYKTLQSQTEQDFEWVLLPNHGGVVPPEISSDNRVKIVSNESSNIGALKYACCVNSNSNVILELDNDDLLAPTALEKTLEAFETGADFVYSDTAEFDENWNPNVYSNHYGWETYDCEYQGHKLKAHKSPEVNAHNIRFVFWAPNHIRAWTKESYLKVGGHNKELPVADDHDLICRYYLAGMKFKHIPEALYFYRVHPNNTVKTKNALIQVKTNEVYNKYIWAMVEKWCKDNNLFQIDLCGGHNPPPGYIPLDINLPEGSSGIIGDLNLKWNIRDNSIGLIRANDAVEHLKDPIHVMNEAYRILAPGGWLMINVPSTNGQGAWADPTHVSFWNKLSFRYYTQRQYANYIPDFKGRFQVSRILEWFPSDYHRENNIPYVEAHLIAVKPGFKAMGEITI